MNNDTFETQYDITKITRITRIKKFYESNKILIFSLISILVIIGLIIYFLGKEKEKEKILLSENYIQAKIYLEDGDKNKAVNILRDIIFSNDPTYSTLSFFLILNQNLITNHNELSNLFDHLLANNEFEKELENLLIFKRGLFNSNFVSELELLQSLKPLTNTDSIWKPHALLLLGEYFVAKKEYTKAREFYIQILSVKNLEKRFYNQARSQLAFITND